jgi:5S rRNA maturation endonuclease (ribonuclease M5)
MTPIEQLLEATGADVHGTNKRNEVTLCCPFCEVRGFTADVNFHLGLNTFNGKAHCFRCDWKSSNTLYTAKQLRFAFKVDFDISERALRTPKRKDKPEVKAPESVDLPPEYESFNNEDFVGRRVRKYLTGRGVSLLQIVRHRIGYAAVGEFAWRAMFPVIGRDRKIYGCVGRAVTPTQTPKYLNSTGLKMLWNTEREASTAIVVEGIMDALRTETALLQVPGMAAVARLGSTITQVQLEQLREYESAIIFPDFDLAGVRGATELARRAGETGIHLSVVIPPGMTGADPGSMNDAEILSYIKDAVKWSSGTEHRLHLASTRRRTG